MERVGRHDEESRKASWRCWHPRCPLMEGPHLESWQRNTAHFKYMPFALCRLHLNKAGQKHSGLQILNRGPIKGDKHSKFL